MKTTVSERGQMVIPKPLRDRLGLGPGQILECWEEHGRLVAAKQGVSDPVDGVYGILRLDHSTDDLIKRLRGAPDAVPRTASAPPKRAPPVAKARRRGRARTKATS